MKKHLNNKHYALYLSGIITEDQFYDIEEQRLNEDDREDDEDSLRVRMAGILGGNYSSGGGSRNGIDPIIGMHGPNSWKSLISSPKLARWLKSAITYTFRNDQDAFVRAANDIERKISPNEPIEKRARYLNDLKKLVYKLWYANDTFSYSGDSSEQPTQEELNLIKKKIADPLYKIQQVFRSEASKRKITNPLHPDGPNVDSNGRVIP